MKNKSGLDSSVQDQNTILIANCPSSWLKPFSVDLPISHVSTLKTKTKCSPMSDGSDQAMSVSSSERQTSSEEDEDSEAETCPLLCEFENKTTSITHSNSDTHRDCPTMNETDGNSYQCQNFDQQRSVRESTKWEKWNSDWSPMSSDEWSTHRDSHPQNTEFSGHDVNLSPNFVLGETELSNNNRNELNFALNRDIWHDSVWSCPRKANAKSTSSTKSFKDIVNMQSSKSLYPRFSLDSTVDLNHKAIKSHANSNGIPESNFVDTEILPMVNPFEKILIDAKPVNYVPVNISPRQKKKLSLVKETFASSNLSRSPEVVETLQTQDCPTLNKNMQSNFTSHPTKTMSSMNMNLKTKADLLSIEQKTNTSNRIIQNLNVESTTFENGSLEFNHQHKEHSNKSESFNKRGSTDDVNFATRSFNNFSLSSSKQKEILRLLQERRKSKESNISETRNNFSDETKILNNQNNPLRSSNVRRRLKRIDRQLIADGLVLEKVRHDPNWKRRNRILCTSDEVLRHFGEPPRKDTNIPSSVPTKPSGIIGDNKISRISNSDTVQDNVDISLRTKIHVPPNCIESPTDNITPMGNTRALTNEPDSNCNGSSSKNSSQSTQQPPKTNVNDGITVPKSVKLSKQASDLFGDFDVYNIETTMPTIDWVAMEAHLARAAEEEDWITRRRNDREEIRKRLALGNEDDEDEQDYYCGGRLSRKPSLSARLQSGMNLQICFMNETASDHESPVEDGDGWSSEASNSLFSSSCSSRESSLGSTQDSLLLGSNTPNNKSSTIAQEDETKESSSNQSKSSEKSKTQHERPSFFFAKQRSWRLRPRHKHEQQTLTNEVAKNCQPVASEDFYTKQARLQAEARLALAQAKEMAKMQMEVEKQKKYKKSPIADIVGLPFTDNKHHLNRQLLLEMNVAQLQVIVNDLHTQIENLNEDLVHLLLQRDDSHMEQDSMLVDIEDLTRYLGAKEETCTAQKQSGKIK